MPSGFDWPRRDGVALGFLAQIDLAEVARACDFDWLPSSGSLVFFYDIVESPWGYDPAHARSWKVEHVSAGGAPLALPGDIDASCVLAERSVAVRRVLLPPDSGPELEALELSDRELDLLDTHREALFDHGPAHQMGGFPSPIQSDDMELECQLVSSGLYCGNASGYGDPRAKELEAGASDWRLLLQLDSDEELNVMWGDVGRLYFWVRAQEARRGDFRGVWTILQCT